MIVQQYNEKGEYVCQAEDYGGPMPHNCVASVPPSLLWIKKWAKRKETGQGWDMVDDHRERRTDGGFSPEHVQEATDYWLPEDAYGTPARHMDEIGPLPEGALLSPPSQSLDELKAQKRQDFSQAFSTIEQRAQRPQSTVLAALMDDTAPPEPDADFIWQLEAIKAENRALLTQLEAATTLEAATAIKPWLPWEQQGSI